MYVHLRTIALFSALCTFYHRWLLVSTTSCYDVSAHRVIDGRPSVTASAQVLIPTTRSISSILCWLGALSPPGSPTRHGLSDLEYFVDMGLFVAHSRHTTLSPDSTPYPILIPFNVRSIPLTQIPAPTSTRILTWFSLSSIKVLNPSSATSSSLIFLVIMPSGFMAPVDKKNSHSQKLVAVLRYDIKGAVGRTTATAYKHSGWKRRWDGMGWDAD